MVAVMAAVIAMAMAATTAVAVAMATASNSCVELICVVDVAVGTITASTMAMKVAAR
jgi:hypothetical protein